MRIYLLPVDVVGSGPNISRASLSIGEPTTYFFFGALGLFGGPRFCAQMSHFSHKLLTFCWQLTQQNLSLTRPRVLATPK